MTRAPASAAQSPRHRVVIVGAGFGGRFAARARLASWPALVAVTRGGAGVYAVCAGRELNRGPVPLDLADTVGAGDCFTSGLLDGLHRADLDGDDVAPLYLGDDITDEDAFRALSGKGISIFVGHADDPEIAGRGTSAAFVLNSIEEMERFLDTPAR